MESRLPITDPQRVRARDNKLWLRDQRRAALYKFNRIPCPCSTHKGTGRPMGIDEVHKHLIRYGRSSDCRAWRGPDDPDSSDEEWEEDYSRRGVQHNDGRQERDSGLQMRHMMRDIYQEVAAFTETEERIDDITRTALETVDNVTGTNDMGFDEPNNYTNCDAPSRQEGDEQADGGPTAEEHHDRRERADADADSNGNRTQNANVSEAKKNAIEEERIKDAKALEDAMCLLYKGSNHSKLGATIMMVNIVATHPSMTEKAADDVLVTLKCLLPEDNCMPSSMYQAKTLTKRLGLDFKNIDGCPTGCTLFDLESTRDLDRCPVCRANRFKDMLNKTRPLKVLRQFKITPRLQRFYRIPVLSKLLRWYSENRSQDGKVRYPADSIAWKHLDNLDPNIFDTHGFGSSVQDVRLQVSCDGICPFKLHRSTWSAWPVLVSFLNLPPWLITKFFFTILTLLIPRRSQVPFEYFDVWIRPLVDELKELWKGVPSYDVSAPEGNHLFNLRAAVLWTTHDFPGYGTVSGASHQGYAACPPCGDQLRGKYAYESKKLTYRDARRWTKEGHILRSTEYNHLFDGHSEERLPPLAKTPVQQQEALKMYQAYLARPRKKRRTQRNSISEAGTSGRASRSTDRRRSQKNSSDTHEHSDRTGEVRPNRASHACSGGGGLTNRVSRRQSDSLRPGVNLDGAVHRGTPIPSSGGEEIPQARRRNGARRETTPDPSKIHGIKRGSLFFQLPYWEVGDIFTVTDTHLFSLFSDNIDNMLLFLFYGDVLLFMSVTVECCTILLVF